MVKGKPWWGPKEEHQRRIVAELLGLSLDDVQNKGKKLPSIKQIESKLAEALTASCKPGLDENEVFRLQVSAELAYAYKDLATIYVGYYLAGKSDRRLVL